MIYVYDKKKGCLIPAGKVPRKRNLATWPQHSESLACSDAQQVRDEQAFLAKHGVKTEYDNEFRPIFTGKRHKKAHYRALEYADPDAGYSEAEPLNYNSDVKRKDMTNPHNRKRRIAEMREELIAKEYRLFGCRVSSL